jgi:heme exporter protein C
MFNSTLINRLVDNHLKWLSVATLLILVIGLYMGLIASPPDYQQGDAVRIMYIHVPAAWMSLFIYTFIAINSIIYLGFKNPIFSIIATSAAPIGACFALITLITGSIWGKPMWGTWWVWDARLTSMFILFLFYISYISVIRDIGFSEKKHKAAAILAIVGLINVPIVKFSVNFWNSLHQPASVFRIDGPTIHESMLIPLMIMAVGSGMYFLTVLAIRVKSQLVDKKIKKITYRSLQ